MQTQAQRTEAAVANRLARDLGTSTPQRIRHSGAPIDVAASGVQRVEDWPMAKLYRSGALGRPDEAWERYEAGRRLAKHHYESGLAGSVHGVDLNRPGGASSSAGMPIPASELAYRHRQHFRAALAALGNDYIGTVTALVVLNEVPLDDAMRPYYVRDDRDARKGEAETAIRIGLDRLRALWE